MEAKRYFAERLRRLGAGEALNVTETTLDGNGIRKVKFNPETARFLVEVPFNKGFVFNLKYDFEGLDHFLRLKGYDKERIKKVHQVLRKEERCPRCKSSKISLKEIKSRSADEPETLVGECENCGLKWRESKQSSHPKKSNKREDREVSQPTYYSLTQLKGLVKSKFKLSDQQINQILPFLTSISQGKYTQKEIYDMVGGYLSRYYPIFLMGTLQGPPLNSSLISPPTSALISPLISPQTKEQIEKQFAKEQAQGII